MNLSANLSGLIDEEDRGALVVDPTWVAYIAAVPDGTSAVIAEYWAEAMRTEYQDPEIHVNDDLLRRVSDRNRSHCGEQGRSSILAELGLHGLGQPVEYVAVLSATGLDHR